MAKIRKVLGHVVRRMQGNHAPGAYPLYWHD